MAFLTKYGTLWGAIPMTAGQVLWVAPSSPYSVDGRSYDASDDNDGLSPEKAKRTIGSAITAATANAGDVICLLPGAHTTATAAAVSKAGLTFVAGQTLTFTITGTIPAACSPVLVLHAAQAIAAGDCGSPAVSPR